MGAITIRQLDDGVIARLKEKAKRNGRSMESELRLQIEAANRADEARAADHPTPDYIALKALDEEAARRMGPDGRLPPGAETADYFRRRREAMFGDRVFPSSLEILREIRGEDPLMSPPDADYP